MKSIALQIAPAHLFFRIDISSLNRTIGRSHIHDSLFKPVHYCTDIARLSLRNLSNPGAFSVRSQVYVHTKCAPQKIKGARGR